MKPSEKTERKKQLYEHLVSRLGEDSARFWFDVWDTKCKKDDFKGDD